MRFTFRSVLLLVFIPVAVGVLQFYLLKMGQPAIVIAFIQTILIALIMILTRRAVVVAPMAKLVAWVKQLRTGTSAEPINLPRGGIFSAITQEVAILAKNLSDARAAAEEEAGLRRKAETRWTSERLKVHVRNRLQGKPLFVVSNREPYKHLHRGHRIDVIVPAGGLVTALDPVLRASGGTWIAYGDGDADQQVVDDRGRIRVPPEEPCYTLKRVTLSKEEEQGYYYGFSNEGLWPLCHIAHTRPIFRSEDWTYYKRVNEKFAEAVLEEVENVEEPCVLIQDYHFALLPRLIKQKRPDARVGLFWHVPWPNPEAFGICPWQREILGGMLGADLIGFHIQFHCNNFLETVDRTMESRVDRERFSVTKNNHTTFVQPFPISVAFPNAFQDIGVGEKSKRETLPYLIELGISAKYIGIGVERMDYTKGVLERFRAIERFFEKYPDYLEKFTFVQIGEPSRTQIKRYQDFFNAVEAKTEQINNRFKTKYWKPIVFLKGHHSHQQILPFYQHADLCMVTSLHDGMNLVAKEFVASREDESGVLILSRFTGASRELRDALIINPYDIEQMADAIRISLEMDPAEKKARMQRMREIIKEHNIYRWAGLLIEELSKVQIEKHRAEKVERDVPHELSVGA